MSMSNAIRYLSEIAEIIIFLKSLVVMVGDFSLGSVLRIEVARRIWSKIKQVLMNVVFKERDETLRIWAIKYKILHIT